MSGIEHNIQQAISYGLADAVQDALGRMETSRALAQIEYLVKSRVARGEFLEGSTPGSENYSAGHRRLRERGGYQTGHVDLQMSGRMLDAWRGEATVEKGKVTLEAGYLDESEEEAAQLAEYHDRLGAGKSKVIRKFIGLTPKESDQVLDQMERRLLEGLGF